jgi:hypothetical protein
MDHKEIFSFQRSDISHFTHCISHARHLEILVYYNTSTPYIFFGIMTTFFFYRVVGQGIMKENLELSTFYESYLKIMLR